MSRIKLAVVTGVSMMASVLCWAGFTHPGNPGDDGNLYEGAMIPEGSAFDGPLQAAADKLESVGCASDAQQVRDMLAAGMICLETVDSANTDNHATTLDKDGINVRPDDLLKSQFENLGFDDDAAKGATSLLAGTLVHELNHFNMPIAPPKRPERPAYIAEAEKLCMLASQESSPEALRAICDRIEVATELAAQEPGNEPLPDPCEACLEVGGDIPQGDPGDPALGPPYVPATSPGYDTSLTWKARIDAITVPAFLQATSMNYLPLGSGIDQAVDARLPSYTIFSKSSEIWVERWNQHISPYGGSGTGSWDLSRVALDYKPTAVAGVGRDRLFVAGMAFTGQAVLREYTFLLDGVRVGYQVRDIALGGQFGIITALVYHPFFDDLEALDADGSRLWTIDVESGDAAVLTDSIAIPALEGCRSMELIGDSTTGAVYALSYELDDSDDLVDSAGVLEIEDVDAGDGLVDGWQVLLP
ncbi:MAG: hypothetical protein H6825_00140 [Planctomycetes bacterium]|nr:hypothetical protein [Planctomycetota bacterium]